MKKKGRSSLGVKTGILFALFALFVSVGVERAALAFDFGQQIAVASAPKTWVDATVNTSTALPTCISLNSALMTGWLLQNTGSNPMRCGDKNVGASQGIVLANGTAGAGSTASFATPAPIYCYSTSGTTAACLELDR